MYKFKMPIGDWSNDGHGICEYYLMFSNKSVEEVREVHHKIKEITGVDLTEICKDYEEDWFYNKEVIDKIIATGFDVENKCKIEKDRDWDSDDDREFICGISFHPRRLAELWVHLLKCVDKELDLEFAEEEKIPMLPFYGFDEKGRHISFVGYGLFE